MRSLAFWPVLRVLSMFFATAAHAALPGLPMPGPFAPHLLTIPLGAAALAWVDLHRRDEVIFFANLGIGLPTLISMYVLPAVVLEGIVALLQ